MNIQQKIEKYNKNKKGKSQQVIQYMHKTKEKSASFNMGIRKQKLNLVQFDFCNHRWLIYGYCFNSHKGNKYWSDGAEKMQSMLNPQSS